MSPRNIAAAGILLLEAALGDRLSSYEVELPPYAPFFVRVDDAACDCNH